MVHFYEGLQSTMPDLELWVGNELRSWTAFDAWLPDFKQGDVWAPITFEVRGDLVLAYENQTVEEYR
jgi:hypothetical protein